MCQGGWLHRGGTIWETQDPCHQTKGEGAGTESVLSEKHITSCPILCFESSFLIQWKKVPFLLPIYHIEKSSPFRLKPIFWREKKSKVFFSLGFRQKFLFQSFSLYVTGGKLVAISISLLMWTGAGAPGKAE